MDEEQKESSNIQYMIKIITLLVLSRTHFKVNVKFKTSLFP